MKTLMLRGGDLVLSGGRLREVSETAKVQQDLRGALAEPVGTDRFHPGWGSELHQFLLTIASESTAAEVSAEVRRVIANYAAVQRDQIEADVYSGSGTRFSTTEVVERIAGIETTHFEDTARVQIRLRMASGDLVTIEKEI